MALTAAAVAAAVVGELRAPTYSQVLRCFQQSRTFHVCPCARVPPNAVMPLRGALSHARESMD